MQQTNKEGKNLLTKLLNPLGANTGGIVDQTNLPAATGITNNPGILGKVIPKFNSLLRGTSLSNTAASTKAAQQVEEPKKDGNAPLIPLQRQNIQMHSAIGNRHSSFASMLREKQYLQANQLTVGKQVERTKKRTLEDFESEYIINVQPLPTIVEEQDSLIPLPSPIYKSDFNILGDEKMQYVGSQPEARPIVVPVEIKSDSQIDVTLYIPHKQQDVEMTKMPKVFEDFENYLKSERDMAGLKQTIEQIEVQESQLNEALINLKQVEGDVKRDNFSKVSLPHTPVSLSTSFFEFHPHLIYSEPSLPAQDALTNLIENSVESGFLTKEIGYSIKDIHCHFWKVNAPALTKVTLGFSTQVLSVYMLNTARHIVIITVEEIHIYEMKIEKDNRFTLHVFTQTPLSTDRNRYMSILQLNNKRLFIGGHHGKLSELTIEGIQIPPHPNSLSARQKFMKFTSQLKDKAILGASKLIGLKNFRISKKIAKKDLKGELPSGAKEMIKQFFGSLFTMKNVGEKRIVTDIIDDQTSKLLIAAISDSKNSSDVEIYDIAKNGFSLLKRITFTELANLIQQRTGQDCPVNSEISKLHYSNSELTIFLRHGPMITVNISIYKPPQAGEAGKKICTYSLVHCLTPQLDSLIDRYESLFDQEYLPDNINEQISWKPLPTRPLFTNQPIRFVPQSVGVQIIDQQIQGSKMIILVSHNCPDRGTRSFVVYFTPNYRRGPINKYTQFLVGISEVPRATNPLGMLLSQTENQRTKISVLTGTGVCNFLIPQSEDFMFQYLQLLLSASNNDALQLRIQSDFNIYLRGQDLYVTMEALLKIILAHGQKMEKTANFIMSNFAQMFYHNQNMIMSASVNQATSRFMTQPSQDPARSIKYSLLSVVKYVVNHLVNYDNFMEIAVSHQIAALANKYFIDFSQTVNQVVANTFIDDSFYLHAYPHIAQHSYYVYELLRIPLLYNSLYLSLKPILQERLFKQKETKVERSLSIRDTELAYLRIQQLLNFIKDNQTDLAIVSVEADFFDPLTFGETPQNLKSELASLLYVTQKFNEGVHFLINDAFNEPSVKAVQTKEMTRALFSLKVEHLLYDGITKNVDVCNLIEHVINTSDTKIIQDMSMQQSFISKEAFSLFLGKKYLCAALSFKEKKFLDETDREIFCQMKQQGYQELMKYPLRVNLTNAIDHFIQLDMLIESVNLCLKCIDYVEDIKSINTVKDSSIQKFYLERASQQRSAITCLIAILKEIIQRTQILEKLEVTPPVIQQPYLVNVRARLEDKTLTVDYLKSLKNKILKLASQTKCELFQIELYDLLYKSNLVQDLRFIKTATPSTPSAPNQMNAFIQKLAKQKITEASLLKGKLEALYQHHVQAKSWAEAFLIIMDQVCFQQSKIEINERIAWLQKAEGCLIKFRTQSEAFNQIEIPQETISKFLRFKDYFLLLIQLRDTALERQSKYNISQDLINKLKVEVVQPDDLCLIALELHQWVQFLKIIEINELRDYQSEDAKAFRADINSKETQSRIDFMYRNILSKRPLDILSTLPKKVTNLKKWLKTLQSYSQIQTEQIEGLNIQFFPYQLVLQLLEEQSHQFFSNTRKGLTEVPKCNWDLWWPSGLKAQEAVDWSPFWHLDFFINVLYVTQEALYDMISKINSQKDTQPDFLLSQSYIIAKWIGFGKKEIHLIVDKMDQGIQDELLYPKNYVESIRLVIDKVKGTEGKGSGDSKKQAAGMIPQQ